jgi:hypothetical protein
MKYSSQEISYAFWFLGLGDPSGDYHRDLQRIANHIQHGSMTADQAKQAILANTSATRLDLSNNKLTSLPAEIGQLKNLTELYLHNNQLTSLPAEIGQLKNLTHLHLYNNQLTSLPAEIGQLTALTRLDLSNNQLTSLPAEIGQLKNLTHLHLAGNQLTSLPAEIGQLQSLTDLDLASNQLTSLPAEIAQLQNLTDLDLDNNPLKYVPNLPLVAGKYKQCTDFYTESISELIGLQQDLADQYGDEQRIQYVQSHQECYNIVYAPDWYPRYQRCLQSIKEAKRYLGLASKLRIKDYGPGSSQFRRLPPELLGYIEQFM